MKTNLFTRLAAKLETAQFTKLWTEDAFDRNAKEIMAEMPDYDKYLKAKDKVHASKTGDVPSSWDFMYLEPFLDREQEYHLFRKYNYLKYKFKQLVESGRTIQRIRKAKILQGIDLLRQIKELKQILTCAQGRLVMNLAKKNKSLDLETSCSDGYYGLSMAVDYFDYRKRIRFSTYAWWVITDRIRKFRIAEVEAFNFLATNNDEKFLESKPCEYDEEYADFREAVQVALKFAHPRERMILKYCFGIDSEPMTYEEVGKVLSISKERVRQLKMRGIQRIQASTNARLIYG
jgi:RNA polymerase primary sigma factor